MRNYRLVVLHKVNQQVEDLRFDGNPLGTTAPLAPVGIKRVTAKGKIHVAAQLGCGAL